MRISFFNDIDFLGGGEMWVLKACRYFASLNHQVSVICPHRSAIQVACQKNGVDVFAHIGPLDKPHPFYEAMYHFLKDAQVDIVYCTVMGNFCEARVLESLAERIRRKTGLARPVVILKAGLPPMYNLTSEYYGAGSGPLVRRLHVVSHSVAKAFIEWYPEMDNGFIDVFYEGTAISGADGKARKRSEDRARWGVPEDHKLVTTVSRLDGMKGQSVLLRAIPDVLKTHPDTCFLIAGEGPNREILQELSDDLGLRQTVRFTGHVEDIPSLLRATDILCHPSLNDGMPNSVIEAMAMSVPVMASSLPGIREVITDGVSGLLCQPNDVTGFATALTKGLNDDARAIEMGRRGREAVEGRFDLNANLDRLLAGLESELDEIDRSPHRKTSPPKPKIQLPVGVLFLMSEIRTGGEETELGILARYLDKDRFQMSVLSCFARDETAPVLERLGWWHIPVDSACHHIHQELGRIQYVVEKIKREDIGIIVACQDVRLAYEVCRQFSPKECRLIEHGGIVEDPHRIPKDRTARYVGVSRKITDAAARVMENPEEAVFIPSMVDTDEYEDPKWDEARRYSKDWIREAYLEPYGFPKDACIVVFVGRLDPKKRVEDLIQAAWQLETDCPEAFFLIVGGHDTFQPEYSQELVRDSADLINSHRLAFTGPRGDIPGLLCACDILVLPSVGEGMAHVINEAGAAGLAVVATDDGAAREQLEDGRCGIIISPGRVDKLAASLRHLIKDKDLRRKLGHRLRQKVRSKYSARVVIEQWHELLTGVAGELCKPPQLRLLAPDESLPFPREIQIQTTTTCNASCLMCPHSSVSKELPMGRMNESVYREILKQCASAKELKVIEPFLMNEPFTDSRIIDRIELAKEMVPQAKVSVTTNGSLVTPKISDRLIRSGLDSIWFSFNGATEKTYEDIMGIDYQKVKKNIEYLVSIRPPKLRICVNMIETRPMKPEIARNIAYWQSLGVDAGSSPLANRAGNVKRFDELNYMPVSERPIRVCELVFYKVFVLYNGDVVLCCMDWRRRVVLGNILKQGIEDIWQGAKYRRIRRMIVQRRVEELDLCSTCSYICS